MTDSHAPIPCFKCDADCWRRGWLLLAEEGETQRNDICDNCLLFHKNVKGAERRFDGAIKPNEPKKKPAPKKKTAAVKKKPAATKKSLKKK
mmetsp:Transcript_134694/g.200453  ORF Transcript_134694/g.200453 Transcript_134694/m.200453 type:complete len:91 (-) Transcript_134694:397-669(-)